MRRQSTRTPARRTSRSRSRHRYLPQLLRKIPLFVAAMLLVLAAIESRARAAFIATMQQVGSNVVAIGSGTIDTAALSFIGSGTATPFVGPAIPGLGLGTPPFQVCDAYRATSGNTFPANFGDGPITSASTGSGDCVSIEDSTIAVPQGYTSGATLSDTLTFADSTFASLGITPGTYTWTWGFGNTADSFTLIASVPEPTSLSLLAVGSLTLLGRMRPKSESMQI